MYRIRGADQQEYGPVTAEVLVQWIAERRLNSTTLVCVDGTSDWKPLADFPEFAPALAAQDTGGNLLIPGGVGHGGGNPTGTSGGEGGRDAALAMVNAPALALMIMGGLGVLWLIGSLLIQAISGGGAMTFPPEMDENMRQQMEALQEAIEKYTPLMSVVGFIVFGLAAYAGYLLRYLRNYMLATVATILVMIPCFSGCPICCFSIPLGIWILIVINKPEVRPYFT
jgi:hypothetical protein